MSLASKAIQKAKDALKKIPGSGSVERLIEKTRAKSASDIDIASITKLTDNAQHVYGVGENVPVQMTPEELNEICNISRLRHNHRCMVTGQIPPPGRHDYSNSLAYHRKRFARYGIASGVEPGKLWPSVTEVEGIKEVASLKYSMTADDILTKAAAVKTEEAEKQAAIRARDELVAANIPLMEKLKEKIYTDAIKLEEELNKAEEKRNKRIEQVRRFFQFTLDVKDPRFKEKMQEMIQSEKDSAKQKAKEAKKLKKAELIAQAEAAKAAALKARREAKAKENAESSDDE